MGEGGKGRKEEEEKMKERGSDSESVKPEVAADCFPVMAWIRNHQWRFRVSGNYMKT